MVIFFLMPWLLWRLRVLRLSILRGAIPILTAGSALRAYGGCRPRRVFVLRPQPRPPFYGYFTNTLWLSILRGAIPILTAGSALRAYGGCRPRRVFVLRPQPRPPFYGYLTFYKENQLRTHFPNGQPSAWGLLGTLIAALASVLTMV